MANAVPMVLHNNKGNMKVKTFVYLIGAIFGAIALAVLSQKWGEPIPQNEMALSIDAITFNQGANAYMKAADDQGALKSLSTNAQGAQAAIILAKKVDLAIDPNHIHVIKGQRLPTFYSVNPSIRIFKFNLGLQQFTYSSKPNYECPRPNQIEADCNGGHVSFDVNMQMEIDRSLPDQTLGVGLFHFIHDQRLQNQRGQDHLLEMWAEQMLHTFVGTLMKSKIATMSLYEVIQKKGDLSAYLLKALNERYNQYGIVFRTAAVTSSIRPPPDQQARIDNVVMKEYQNDALRLREGQYMPVLQQMQLVDQTGRQKVQDEHNRGRSVSIATIASANKDRRETFNKLVGPENYVTLEQLIQMNKALVNGGNTTIAVVPRSLQYVDGLGKLPRPTKAAADEHIFGTRTDQRTSTLDPGQPASGTNNK